LIKRYKLATGVIDAKTVAEVIPSNLLKRWKISSQLTNA
jgi:hypothetical protein